ncbi:MAG TPA: hypothetical protein PLH45_08320, partial [Synergistales bacterium]|nr:hypothetical protein [Synergistales bacterium]
TDHLIFATRWSSEWGVPQLANLTFQGTCFCEDDSEGKIWYESLMGLLHQEEAPGALLYHPALSLRIFWRAFFCSSLVRFSVTREVQLDDPFLNPEKSFCRNGQPYMTGNGVSFAMDHSRKV